MTQRIGADVPTRTGLLNTLAERGWLYLKEFAQLIGYSSVHAGTRRYVKHGVKVGQGVRVPEEDILVALKERSPASLNMYYTVKARHNRQERLEGGEHT